MTTRLTLSAGRPEPQTAPQTIDMTPTWAAIMPALVAALQHGTPEGQRLAAAELESLAAKVDSANGTARERAAELAEARAALAEALELAKGRERLAEELAEARADLAKARADLETERADLAEARERLAAQPARFEQWRAQFAQGLMSKAATAKGDGRLAQSRAGLAHAARLYSMAEAFAQMAHALNPGQGHDSDMADSARLARLAANNAEAIPARDMLAADCKAALIDGAAMLAAYAEGKTHNESRGQARATIRDMRAAIARLSDNPETPKGL